MKKFILFALMLVAFGFANAQTHKIYALLVVDGSNDMPVIITETTTAGGTWSGFDFKSNYLRDENGDVVKFNNFLPLLGYVESIGWTVPEIEGQIKENQASAINGRSVFLLSKEVDESQWLQWIERGKFVKKDKKSKKDKNNILDAVVGE